MIIKGHVIDMLTNGTNDSNNKKGMQRQKL